MWSLVGSLGVGYTVYLTMQCFYFCIILRWRYIHFAYNTCTLCQQYYYSTSSGPVVGMAKNVFEKVAIILLFIQFSILDIQ